MAKELPYFKFEPNQWENGNIQICSREDKGLYLDLCSMYWSRLGDVPFKLAVQKLCGGNASAFDSLVNEDIFVVIDDMICIHFLNEQLEEFKDTSKTNQKNALEGWAKRRETKALKNNKSEKNATASKPQSETNAIREEKRRGEEIKQDTFYSEKSFLSDWNELRTKHLNKPSFCNRIGHRDSQDDFKELLKHYTREQFKNAMIGLFKQKEVPNGNEVMRSSPKHLLKDLEPYLTAFQDQNEYLYSKKKKSERL